MLKSLFGRFARRRSTGPSSAESASMRRWSKEESAAGKASPEAKNPPVPSSAESTPMRRWAEEELAAELASLESNPNAPLTKEVAYRVTDYMVQHYLPADAERTQARWQEARKRLHARVDESIAEHQANPDAKPAWQKENEAREARDAQLRAPYRMSRDEFMTRIMPALCRFPFMPAPSQVHPLDASNLWRASFPITADSTWPEKYEARDAKDALIGRGYNTALEVCSNLRANYELLRKAKAAGFAEVRVLTGRCKCFERLGGQDVSIADALAAFDDGSATVPLLPPAESACARLESPRVCHVNLFPLETPREGDDPEFAAWLKEHLRVKR